MGAVVLRAYPRTEQMLTLCVEPDMDVLSGKAFAFFKWYMTMYAASHGKAFISAAALQFRDV
jgi:hypothetical protein